MVAVRANGVPISPIRSKNRGVFVGVQEPDGTVAEIIEQGLIWVIRSARSLVQTCSERSVLLGADRHIAGPDDFRLVDVGVVEYPLFVRRMVSTVMDQN